MGGENAGAVDIGDGLCVVMKIESHNHPSAIEPYQGAATGVGGIVRDIFAMGARPIALLDSLRFGPLDEPRNRYLFGGVVGGHRRLRQLPGHPDRRRRGLLRGLLLRQPAGQRHVRRHGAHRPAWCPRARRGAGQPAHAGRRRHRPRRHRRRQRAWPRASFDERSAELRPTVQVGNPFLEKLLMEACLELAEKHPDWIVGLQDLGAAGLTSSARRGRRTAAAPASRSTSRRCRAASEGMTPYEVMLSESQERMLVIVKTGARGRRRGALRALGAARATSSAT